MRCGPKRRTRLRQRVRIRPHESTHSRRLASARNTMAENFQRIAAHRLGVHATGDVLGLLQSRVKTSLES